MGAGIRQLGGREKAGIDPATEMVSGEYIPATRRGVVAKAPPPKARGKHKLSDRAIAAWIRAGKAGKLFDGGGLYLAAPGGVPRWYVKYRHGGRESTYSVGQHGTDKDEYPLATARDELAKVKGWLAAGLDPNLAKRSEKTRATAQQGETFRVVAAEWLREQHDWSADYKKVTGWRLERDLYPVLGNLPIAQIEPNHVLAALQTIKERGSVRGARNPCHEQARKCRQIAGQVFRFAIATGRAKSDPATALREATKVPRAEHRATIPLSEMKALFTALYKVPSELPTKLALYWVILTACRTSETRFATWSEIDERKALWKIPGERMKMRDPHVVPLSTQAIAVLERAKEIRASADPDALLFPGFSNSGALSENALLSLLARAGYFGKQTAHGFRSAFSTWSHEEHEALPDVIELALSHNIGGVRGAYNHGKYVGQRRELLQAWADQLTAWGLRLP